MQKYCLQMFVNKKYLENTFYSNEQPKTYDMFILGMVFVPIIINLLSLPHYP